MHPNEFAALLLRLQGLSSALQHRRLATDEAGMTWRALRGPVSLAGDDAESLWKLAAQYAKKPHWVDHFSEEFIRKEFASIIVTINLGGVEAGREQLDQTVTRLETFEDRLQVIVPIDGLQIRTEQLKIGDLSLVRFDGKGIDLVASLFPVGNHSDQRETGGTVLWKNQMRDHSEITSVAILEQNAEPILAKERAFKIVRHFLDILNFTAASDHSLDFNTESVASISGNLPSGLRTITTVSSSGLSWNSESVGPYRLDIGPHILDRIELIGLLPLVDHLVFRKQPLTNLETAVQNGLHWFSLAQNQVENATALLFLTTALEALLGPRKGEATISTTIARHAALLLSRVPEDRAAINKRIIELYGTRSSLTHGSVSEVTEFDVSELRLMVMDVLLSIMAWEPSFESVDGLFQYITSAIREATFNAIIEPNSADRKGSKTLRELRESRGWTIEEFAGHSKLEPSEIGYFEGRNVVPNMGYLSKAAQALGVTTESVRLPSSARILSVKGHRFLLVAHAIALANWEAIVEGYDISNAIEWPVRPIIAAFPDIDSPSILLSNKEHMSAEGVFRGRALDLLEAKVVSVMERALLRTRQPDEPDDWTVPAPPEHWKRRMEARALTPTSVEI